MAFGRPTDLFAQLDVIPLPPREQWVPSRGGAPSIARLLAVVAAIAFGLVVTVFVLRWITHPVEPELVPAASPSPTTSPTRTPIVQSGSQLPPDLLRTGTHRVAGLVYQTVASVRRPVPGVPVNVWVDTESGGGYSLWYALGHGITTDANGRFELTDLGDSTLVFWVVGPGLVQQSPEVVKLRSDETVEIELVTEAAAAAGRFPIRADREYRFAPLHFAGTVSGVVYETVSGVRRPVAGARVSIEWIPDVIMAETITDENGRYSIGGLPYRKLGVYAARAGYPLAYTNVDVIAGFLDDVETPLDIELRSRP